MSPVACSIICLLLSVIPSGVLSAEESSTSSPLNETKPVSGRAARKDYAIYSPPDNYASKKSSSNFYIPDAPTYKVDTDPPQGFDIDSRKDNTDQPPAPPVFTPPTGYEEYIPVGFYKPPLTQRPPRYYNNPMNAMKGNMYKSGSSVNWNVWKGDPMDAGDPDGDLDVKGAPLPDLESYYYPTGYWKGDSWTPDQMSSMMMMMNQMQTGNKPKFGGLLSKLTQEPIALLVAAILPFSILLAAVLPTLVNMLMNGGLPTITTTATGNKGRSLDNAEFLSPVIEALTTFGAKTFENPDCMQKIFCQVTKGNSGGNETESRSFQKALYKASRLIDGYWLDTFGVKSLFDSMEDGNCEKVSCSANPSTPRAHKKTLKEKLT